MKRSLFICILLTGLLTLSCSSGNPAEPVTEPELPCVDGAAGPYSCHNIDLMALVGPEELGTECISNDQNDRPPSCLNDIWGWTDPGTGREYALVGMVDGVSFVDVTVPTEPVVVGVLPEPEGMPATAKAAFHAQHDEVEGNKSSWRDLKVFDNHLYVVSDNQPHGMQVFNLEALRSVEDPPATFSPDHHYREFGYAHNIAINEQSGYAYVAGSDRYGGGLIMLDLSNPLQPTEVGHHSDDRVGVTGRGYVHDTQCVIYNGPDSRYSGRELCFNSSENALAIADVTDKSDPETIGTGDYEGRQYVHQGWLTEDHAYFLLDDEGDERAEPGSPTRTYVFDLQDLENPSLVGTYEGPAGSIDHNQFVRGSHTYQANYTSGLRILNLNEISDGMLTELAWFDTFPGHDLPRFQGAWSNYPFFESGIVIVSDINRGLFILRPRLSEPRSLSGH